MSCLFWLGVSLPPPPGQDKPFCPNGAASTSDPHRHSAPKHPDSVVGTLPEERDVLLSSASSPFTGDIKASAELLAAESIYYVNLLVCVVECARCGARLLWLLLLLLLSGFTDCRPAAAFRNESTNHPLPTPNAPNNTQTVLHRLLHTQIDIDSLSHTHTHALVRACNQPHGHL